MATHSSILAWKIPWTEEPGGLHSLGSERVSNDGACTHWHLEGNFGRMRFFFQSKKKYNPFYDCNKMLPHPKAKT